MGVAPNCQPRLDGKWISQTADLQYAFISEDGAYKDNTALAGKIVERHLPNGFSFWFLVTKMA